jgi:hypothetical protein
MLERINYIGMLAPVFNKANQPIPQPVKRKSRAATHYGVPRTARTGAFHLSPHLSPANRKGTKPPATV